MNLKRLAAYRFRDADLLGRLSVYGRSHGAYEDASGYREGSLARLVDAMGDTPVLPSLKAEPEFRCGTEFATLPEELRFLQVRGVDVQAALVEVTIAPGELLLFDNLAVAHGRRGRRAPGELHQRVFGHRALDPLTQERLRDRVLVALATHDSVGRVDA